MRGVIVDTKAGAMRRSGFVVACSAVVAGTLALGPAVRAADAPPSAPASAVLEPLTAADATGAAPTPAGVLASLAGLLRGPGRTINVLVIDPATETVLLDRRSHAPLIPASTTKLATAAAALHVLGPDDRLPTLVKSEGETLYLVGGGDPSLRRTGKQQPGDPASLKQLARATADALSPGITMRLVYDDHAFTGPALGPGWSRGFPAAGVVPPISALVVDGGRVNPGGVSRVSDPARQAATVFAGLLRDQGITVSGVERGRTGDTAVEIARVESPTVGELVERMLTDSDNAYAEALAHLVGGAALGKPSFAGGAQATLTALSDLGIDAAGMSLVDGSGLSVRDRIPAAALADILGTVMRREHPELAGIAPGLPIAGFTGTLADRFASAATRPGRGRVQAKTGTLTGVVTLAGLVRTASNRVLVFALMQNKVGSLLRTRERMDRIASALAQCGCSG